MPTVLELIESKGGQIFSVPPEATAMEAIRRMNHHQIGALVVMTGDSVVGMFTERDVLRRIVAESRSPMEVSVAEVMTTDVICCEHDTDIADASEIMKQRRIRHLPVCRDGRMLGMISIGDLNAFYASHQEQTILYLQDYIYGRV